MSSPPHQSLLIKLVHAILESTEIFNYLQYLQAVEDIPLFNTEMEKSFNTLELFTFGSISDYVAQPRKYLKLTPLAISKLRMLTLVTLAEVYDEVDLSFLCVQLRASTYLEGFLVLFRACQAGVITTTINIETDRVHFFTVRQRNSNILLVEGLINVRSAIQPRCSILLLPHNYQFTNMVKRIVDMTVLEETEACKLAELELMEFVKNSIRNPISAIRNKDFKIEQNNIMTNLDEEQVSNEKDAAYEYDADGEMEKEEEKSKKKLKKKLRQQKLDYSSE